MRDLGHYTNNSTASLCVYKLKGQQFSGSYIAMFFTYIYLKTLVSGHITLSCTRISR